MPQDTMITSTAELTRFRPTSTSPAQSRSELFSHFYASSTDAHPLAYSPARFFLRSSRSQEPFTTSQRQTTTSSQENNDYLSPPLTGNPIGGSVSLSPLTSLDSIQSNFVPPGIQTYCFGGVLDSPLVMYTEPFRLVAPLSPPPTLPISSSSLPQAESDPYPSSPSEAHDLDFDFQWAHFDAPTPSSQSSCSSLQSPPPLSPVSPQSTEWLSHGFNFPALSLTSPLRNALAYDGICYHDPDARYPHDKRLDEPTSPKSPASSLLRVQDPLYPRPYYTEHEICESPQPFIQDLEPIEFGDTSFLPPPFGSSHRDPDPRGDVESLTNDNHDELGIPDSDQRHPSYVEIFEEQALEPPYPHAPFPPTSSPAIRGSSLPDYDDLEMDVDLPDFFGNPPSSPSRRSYSALPKDDLELPDSSPSPSYPDLNVDGDTSTDTIMLSPPESPSLSFLSLPGADTDGDLIPLELAPTKSSSSNDSVSPSPYPMSTHPLLVIDDSTPEQSLHQRSPSPEPCALFDMNLLTPQIPQTDEDLRKMCGLLKRARDKEKAARQIESIIEDEERVARSIGGPSGKGVADAWDKLVEARRKTRKMKERVREIATLLRLKLAQRGWKIGKDESGNPVLVPMSPEPGPTATVSLSSEDEDGMKVDSQQQRLRGVPQKRQRITSPRQLLVKMIMDRHEPRYNPNLRAGIAPKRKSRSPLARTSVSAREVEVEDDVDNDAPDSALASDVMMGDINGSVPQGLDDLDLGLGSLQIPS